MNQPSTEERLVSMESHLAHLERLVDQLNAVVRQQDSELRQLNKGQQGLTQKLQTYELEQIQKQNEKPPHYE